MTYESIRKKAEEFCKENGIDSAPVEIIRICNDLGIKVFENYLKEDVSGLIIVDDKKWEEYDSDKFILVNLYESAARRRFTVAHELAHYILHRNGNKLYAHRDMNTNDTLPTIEREANYFAANILMPEEVLKDFIWDVKVNSVGKVPRFIMAKKVADAFAVSEAAAEVRLKQLGMK